VCGSARDRRRPAGAGRSSAAPPGRPGWLDRAGSWRQTGTAARGRRPAAVRRGLAWPHPCRGGIGTCVTVCCPPFRACNSARGHASRFVPPLLTRRSWAWAPGARRGGRQAAAAKPAGLARQRHVTGPGPSSRQADKAPLTGGDETFAVPGPGTGWDSTGMLPMHATSRTCARRHRPAVRAGCAARVCTYAAGHGAVPHRPMDRGGLWSADRPRKCESAA
jgi:hypothetical protein